jgi:hypothetical protein
VIVDTLTRNELKDLTGLQRAFAVRGFLTREKIPFMTGSDGWPRVLRDVILRKLGGQSLPYSIPEPRLRLRHDPAANASSLDV